MAARFPGGFAQFAEIAAQLPEEVLEDFMIAEVDNPGVPQGMPGQIPGAGGMFADFSDDEDEEVPQAHGRHQEPLENVDEGDLEEDEDEDEEELEEVAVSCQNDSD